MIRLLKVSKRYPGQIDALKEINLEIQAGEIVFLTGHSGAGKSTLLKLIGGIEPCSQGQIWIDNRSLNRLQKKQIPGYRRQVGMIFQQHRLLYDRTVFANVALPLYIVGMKANEIQRRVRAVLDKVGLLHKINSDPITLSSGEQQRVGIARAVVGRPKLLLADEPTGNLDPALSREIMLLFERFHQLGMTILIASHDLALISSLRHRILVLEKGRLLTDSATAPETH